MDLIKIRNFTNLVSNRNINHPLMNSNTQRLKRSELLPSSRCPRGDKSTEHFAGKGLFYPESAGGVPECLPLGGEVTVSGGDSYRLARTAKLWVIAMQGGGEEIVDGWI